MNTTITGDTKMTKAEISFEEGIYNIEYGTEDIIISINTESLKVYPDEEKYVLNLGKAGVILVNEIEICDKCISVTEG
jgi:hypothetical protein